MRCRACLHSGLVYGLGLSAILWTVSGCETSEPAEPQETSQAETDSAPIEPSDALRTKAIEQTIQSLQEECRQHGGDYDQWSQSLQPYRDALKARIGALKPNHPEAKDPYTRFRLLEAVGDPPLFEQEPDAFLTYLLNPEVLGTFRRRNPLAVLSRWLRIQGIDLLFMPVPKMTEVYPDRQAQPCPADRVVAPHLRRLWLELLQNDVEVIDLLPTFLTLANRDGQPLYFPDDPHWGPRGWHVAAKILAERLQRYLYVRCAREKPPLFRLEDRPWFLPGFNYPALSPAQQQRVDRVRPLSGYDVIPRTPGGSVVDQKSPIAFVGDSFNNGLMELVAYELNLPVAKLMGGNHATQAFTEAMRNPEVFEGRKVVVMVICNPQLIGADWSLPPQLAVQAGKGTGP
jgi:hypothetical protein